LPALTDNRRQPMKFRNMVYGKNYILNIDNQVTNRQNDAYINELYKNISLKNDVAGSSISKPLINPLKARA
jgi:hypothetical protein